MEAVEQNGLYRKEYEHDACGVGFVANIHGIKSHEIILKGIEVLGNLLHRGASGEDGKTGDGAGILIHIPDLFLRKTLGTSGIALPTEGDYGVGMVFAPQDAGAVAKCRKAVEDMTAQENLTFICWRDVPMDDSVLVSSARLIRPAIMQFFVTGKGVPGRPSLEQRLFILKKQIQNKFDDISNECYVVSLSSQTIVYKGMMMGNDLGAFYTDLTDESVTSAIAVIHQRYSTNTFPSWRLAQPFRMIGHNGEINTLKGNINQMKAREQLLESDIFGPDIKKALPVVEEGGSDSAAFDNVLDLLVSCGRDLPHAIMMLIPEAWGAKYPNGPDLKGFFEYHAGLMEPWDGPAAVVFTNGKQIGAILDRNGLRPIRYTLTKDGFMVLASEAGVLDIKPEDVIEKGALRPGQIIMADLVEKRLLMNGEIKAKYARRNPYRRWVDENKIVLHGFFNDIDPVNADLPKLMHNQLLFGYTREDLRIILEPMASTKHEPVGSMGFDAPLAVLSEKSQLLYAYFKQLFAQVTNPPIDPIREELVMSLMTFMGNPGNILAEVPHHARLIKLRHPIMSNEDVVRLKTISIKDFKCATLNISFPAGGDGASLQKALDVLCAKAEQSVRAGESIIVLSDRNLSNDVVPIPALLAVSAVNRHLISKALRTASSIIVETGEAREVHHMALLLGFGATAINPYLAFEIIADLAARKVLEKEIGVTKALENYIEALCEGLRKIMSKMGISTLRSYRSSEIFEAIGVSTAVMDAYFTGTASRIGGIGLNEIASEAVARHRAANSKHEGPLPILPSGGQYQYNKEGERHLWTPDSISKLQQATRLNDSVLYREYAKLINDQSVHQSTIRGLLKFKTVKAIPISEVEPVDSIVRRFVTGAMSFGSISREAHETLAVAMNRLGGMSNSGEGGEDPARYKRMPNGDSKCSAVKQIASGRFGVTVEYLSNAKELQIKIAQGAKPGEGGQLPGHKVNPEIARVRNSTPGVTLISPPPHHDIYSIEDIKQLMFDLKNANPSARISVKLVSEAGVGTIAAGVAKGHADMILISGYDGGTGASPLSSMKNAGAPWELGLVETQQTLVKNNLRKFVRLQADGQMKTGRDVAIAALLGAEEFGFATAPLVVCGCVMMRKCHQNTCSVGVATQDPELRKRFSGKPEYVVNFFRMVAEELREYMAQLGFRKVDEMIGRSDMLEPDKTIGFWKVQGMDLAGVLTRADLPNAPVRFTTAQNHEIDTVLDQQLIVKCREAIEDGKKVEITLPVRNVNRAVGTMLSGVIAKKHGSAGLADDTIRLNFNGAAGQSFGAFGAKGITMVLEGESNDYLGKGLSGARIIVKPYKGMKIDPTQNIICGNVLLYGATSGELYINGRAGERFGIRNSGVLAVVEGVGDHGCEYMTGGRVVVLGRTGVNFAAGMSGGIAYIYDIDREFDARCNLSMVDIECLDDSDRKELRILLERHHMYTGSIRAEEILGNWENSIPYFTKVLPLEYRKVLGRMSKEDMLTEREAVVHG